MSMGFRPGSRRIVWHCKMSIAHRCWALKLETMVHPYNDRGIMKTCYCRVGVRVASTPEGDGEATKKVGYCGRIKKCASRKCWGLGLSVSADEALPNPNDHEFPLFEGTQLTANEKAKLRQENIQFNESLPKLKDPGLALPPRRIALGQNLFRSIGLPPAEGKDEDRKPAGEVRAKQQAEKVEKRALLHRGDGLVKGRQVRNRNEMTKAMRDNTAYGIVLKGRVESERTGLDAEGEPERRFLVKVKGLAGSDTDKTHEVVIKRVCECSCTWYRRMMDDRRSGLVWCKHIYAILIKVLGFNRHDPLLKAVAFNKAEWMQIMSKPANVKALEGY